MKNEMNNNVNKEMEVYAKDYNEAAFEAKTTNFAKVMGGDVLYMGCLLKEMFLDPTVPFMCKAPIVMGLGYLIAPVDVLPDTIPLAGFVDDGLTLQGVIKMTAAQIREYHKEKAIANVKRMLKLNDKEAAKIMLHVDNLI